MLSGRKNALYGQNFILMKSLIKDSFDTLIRVMSFLIQGYLFGSRFGRFEFQRSFFRPWSYTFGRVGAWLYSAFVMLLGLVLLALPVVAFWGALWFGYILGFVM